VSKDVESNQSEDRNFLLDQESVLTDQFSRQGFVVHQAESSEALDYIRAQTAIAAATALNMSAPDDPGAFLNTVDQHVDVGGLNNLRMSVIESLLGLPDFHINYFNCARGLLESLVGNELAMQRNIALSVQLPDDDGSLLPLHSDAWGSECSPFEVVLWVPLVDCYDTKSMYLLPPEANAKWVTQLEDYKDDGVEALFKAIEPEVTWVNIKYGEVLAFTPSVMHGNRVNQTDETRWSFNIRFKGLFTPYSGKRLGEYFMPISVRPASRVGLEFEMPGAFYDS
jgi:sporadic carbohydrate cluster 2OG-Fe(II) oxygenase